MKWVELTWTNRINIIIRFQIIGLTQVHCPSNKLQQDMQTSIGYLHFKNTPKIETRVHYSSKKILTYLKYLEVRKQALCSWVLEDGIKWGSMFQASRQNYQSRKVFKIICGNNVKPSQIIQEKWFSNPQHIHEP